MSIGWSDAVAEIGREFAGLGDIVALTRLAVRLLLAVILSGLLGYQRQCLGKPAGTRTHMLVALGAAMLVVTMTTGGTSADLSRVIQGIVTGIGFIGAGAILKLEQREQVRGLTTAADVWLATAVGVAAGAGHPEIAIPGTLLALFILTVVQRFEKNTGHGGSEA